MKFVGISMGPLEYRVPMEHVFCCPAQCFHIELKTAIRAINAQRRTAYAQRGRVTKNAFGAPTTTTCGNIIIIVLGKFHANHCKTN